MAFFKMGGKKKKDDIFDIQMPPQQEMLPAHSSPIEQVMMMKQQGYTNNQIVQTLQSQGYNTDQVFDAINQSGLSAQGAQQQPVREYQEQQPDTGMPEYGHGPYETPPSYTQQQQAPPGFHQQPGVQTHGSIDDERIQEVAEAIIDEKWEDLAKDIRKVAEWKEKTEDRISKLEQQILDLKMSIDSLTKGIMSKISSYDQNIVDVGTEIKAMEKVFQKVLPSLTENVNKLDRITRGVNAKEQPQQKK